MGWDGGRGILFNEYAKADKEGSFIVYRTVRCFICSSGWMGKMKGHTEFSDRKYMVFMWKVLCLVHRHLKVLKWKALGKLPLSDWQQLSTVSG